MGGDWQTFRLGDLYDFSSGLSKPRSEFGFGHTFLTFKDVLDNYFVPETLSALVNSTEKERNRCSIRRGDVFLTRTSETQEDLGMSCVALKDHEGATFNGFTKRLRPRSGTTAVIPEYAAYFFRGRRFRRDITAMSSLSTRASLNNGMLERLTIDVPPVEVQQAIGRILKALDDKIELNRRMNATLESLAAAIFKSWFVDFDPVRAKMDGRQPAGMDEATAGLFPDSFCEIRGLGHVPCGWPVEPFSNHVTADRGLSYKGSGLGDAGTPMHNLNSIREGGGYKDTGLKFYSGEFRSKHVVAPGDVIIANTEQGFDRLLIGYAAMVPQRFGNEGIYSHHLYRIRPVSNSPITPHFLLHLINTGRWHDWICGFSNGTTVNMLPLDALQKPLLVVPERRLIQKFTNFAASCAARIEQVITESETLAALRDTLLPKLLSGELRVTDAERVVEAAV